MKDAYTVGDLVVGAECDRGRWRVYVEGPKEKLKLHLQDGDETTAKAIAAILAGMVREEVGRATRMYS